MTAEKKSKILIVDANSLFHRAYHALPSLRTENGEATGAVYGFMLAFLKELKEIKPKYVAVCFDFPAPTFRHKEFKDYKAGRPPADDELKNQFPKLKKALRAFNVPFFEKKGYEADDLAGTISKKALENEKDLEVIIISGDRDLLQLVNNNIKIGLLKTGVKNYTLYNKDKVKEKFGLLPKRMNDFKALRGDPSDNIPGAKGIGKVTATKLLNKFENIEEIYKALEEGKLKDITERTKKILEENKDKVFLSKKLVTIKREIDLNFDLKKTKLNYDNNKVIEMFKEYNFKNLIKRFKKKEEKKTLKMF